MLYIIRNTLSALYSQQRCLERDVKLDLGGVTGYSVAVMKVITVADQRNLARLYTSTYVAARRAMLRGKASAAMHNNVWYVNRTLLFLLMTHFCFITRCEYWTNITIITVNSRHSM